MSLTPTTDHLSGCSHSTSSSRDHDVQRSISESLAHQFLGPNGKEFLTKIMLDD